MNHTMQVESLAAKEFLVIKGFANLYDTARDASAVDGDVWEIMRSHFADGAVERLKEASGSNDVYMLFCNTCKRDDKSKSYVCSYDIACENLNGSGSNEFGTVKLKACEYAVYDCEFNNETALQDAHEPTDELFWGDNGWLKQKPYVCAIDFLENSGKGYAQIELYTPFDIGAKRFNMQIRYPIIPKDK